MNLPMFIGGAVLTGQCGWYLYTGEWVGVSLLVFTGTPADVPWESWHGLREVLSYVPVSGLFLLWGWLKEQIEDMERKDAERAKRHMEYIYGREK